LADLTVPERHAAEAGQTNQRLNKRARLARRLQCSHHAQARDKQDRNKALAAMRN
jgi:hypothetical protein